MNKMNKWPAWMLIKEILGRIIALYALILFIVTLLITVLAVLIIRKKYEEPNRSHQLHKWFHGWMRFFTSMIFSPVRVQGSENFQKNENYIIVCNHRSLMDVPVSTPFIPGANKTLAKIEMARIPIFGVVYRSGSVLVDRTNERSRRQCYDDMKKVLNSGIHMCIYPEGTRNKSLMPLKSFHDGAFKLSTDTGKKIIPALIFNTSKVFPSNKIFYVWPQPMRVLFLPAVSPEGKSSDQLKEEVFTIMLDKLIKKKKTSATQLFV